MMSYISVDYYKDEYKGKLPQDENDLPVLIERASEVIDMLTNYRLQFLNVSIDDPSVNQFIANQVRKATAAQVEYFIANGGYESRFLGNSEAQSVSIGSFSYNKEQSNKDEDNSNKLTNTATVEFLVPTGLLYAGVGVRMNVH